MCNKKFIVCLFKMIKIMQPKTLLAILNYAFFHSICNYRIMSCGGAYKTVKSILQTAQNWILKIMMKQKNEYTMCFALFTLISFTHNTKSVTLESFHYY